ncbi:MAG: type 1 glutamine amidotransferase domain-containing protein [Pseudomonadota bacterium]
MTTSATGPRRALIISADGFEDSELLVPLRTLTAAGMAIDVASVARGPLTGKHGARIEATLTVQDLDPSSYALLILPGGRAPARLRTDAGVLDLVRHFFAAGKPIAAICHGPQILAAAGLLRGRAVTGYRAIADELREAGARYLDQHVVVDGPLITSRQPADLPAFIAAILGATGRDAEGHARK